MKANFTLLLTLFIGLLYAQESTLYVKYSYFNTNAVTNKDVYAELINSQNKSKFILYTKKINPTTRYFDENNEMKGELIDFEDEVYKDFSQNSYFANSPIPFTYKFTSKDSLNHLKWELKDNIKEILGYSCTEAHTSFHGRNYIAYFTYEIPIFDGPWKFNGLPGLILELKEETGMLEIVAYELKTEAKIKNIDSKLDIVNAFYWDELINRAKLKFKATLNNMRINDPNANSTIDSSNSLELFDINEK